jgi:Family of unknown function (DUF6502)
MKGASAIPRELMDSLVLSIVSFMNKAGMQPAEIETSFHNAMRDLSARIASGGKERLKRSAAIGCDTIAGAVLRAWHRDAAYLDEFANPAPLSMSGRGRSLATLVGNQDSRADVASLVAAMQRTGLIRRLNNKKYLPNTSAATISQMHPFAVDHVVKTVLRLVETVTRNMRLEDSNHSLVERYAHIPDLDAKEAHAFSEFSRQQGAACLEAIEDWLEARRKGKPRVTSGKSASLSAGMHVFAYLEQPPESRRRKPPAKSRPATSSPSARAG